MIKQLIRLANELDKKGLMKEADYLDMVIKQAQRVDEQGYHTPAVEDRDDPKWRKLKRAWTRNSQGYWRSDRAWGGRGTVGNAVQKEPLKLNPLSEFNTAEEAWTHYNNKVQEAVTLAENLEAARISRLPPVIGPGSDHYVDHCNVGSAKAIEKAKQDGRCRPLPDGRHMGTFRDLQQLFDQRKITEEQIDLAWERQMTPEQKKP